MLHCMYVYRLKRKNKNLLDQTINYLGKNLKNLINNISIFQEKILTRNYSNNQKTMEKEDDIIAIFARTWCYYREKSFTRRLLNQ